MTTKEEEQQRSGQRKSYTEVARKKRGRSRTILQTMKACQKYPCNCSLLFQSKLKDNTEMVRDMKEQHEPELEKLNHEVTKLRKLKENLQK